MLELLEVLEQDKYIEDNGENKNIGQCLDISTNNSLNNLTYTVGSSKSLNYRYTIKDIENFFASDSVQQKEHPIEESICRPLIGQQNDKPLFYYCKEDRGIENIHLNSIEDHIRLKDPQRHKAKLLEILQKENLQL